jgi:type I restriction enzyme S subunit
MLPNKRGIIVASSIIPECYTKFQPCDILISNIRPYFQKIWFANRYGGCSNDVLCIRGNEKVIPVYLYYLLSQDIFFDYVMAGSKGTKMPRGDKNQIMQYEFPLPPLETQRRIAAILSSLDDKIENNNRINRNLEAQAQALFKSWFVDFEPFGGKMPEDWKEGTLGDIVTVKRGGSPRPIQHYLSDKGYRWLKISDATAEASPFISHIVEHIKEEGLNKTVFIKQGSLVLSNSATPGLPKFVDLDTCIHDGWLYFPQSYFSNEYLYLLFQRERLYLLSQGNGSVFTNLKTEIVKNLSVTVPSKDVLNNFQKIIGRVFEEILNNQRENVRLAALRDTLLPKLMKGEIEL